MKRYNMQPVFIDKPIRRSGGLLDGTTGYLALVLGRERDFNNQFQPLQIYIPIFGQHVEGIGREVDRK